MVTTEELSVVTPADWVPGPKQGSWTYDDYAAIPNDGQHYEIVNGVLLTLWLKWHLLAQQPLIDSPSTISMPARV